MASPNSFVCLTAIGYLYIVVMRIGCLGLIGLTIVALFLLQLLSNSAKSFLTVIPLAVGVWFFLYLQNRKDEADSD